MVTEAEAKKLKNVYYILARLVGYFLPFAYFFITAGLTQQVTKVVLSTVFVGLIGVIRIAMDIPGWTETWEPSFKKGFVKAIPSVLLFIILITLGLTLKFILEQRIQAGFSAYFEVVFVLFGSHAAGNILWAWHLKYKEIYLLHKGYVLGVVNRR